MPELILASGSPRRKELLRLIGLPFRVVPSELEEDIPAGETNPAGLVRNLAREKARHVARLHPDHLVLGADTVVVLDGDILGKPRDAGEAVEMLSRLSGRTHLVYTGLALVAGGGRRELIDHEQTLVTIKPLDQNEIHAYVNTGEPLDKAGAYAIQGLGSVIVPRVEGCYFNVVGLPLARLAIMLEHFGVKVVSDRQEGGR